MGYPVKFLALLWIHATVMSLLNSYSSCYFKTTHTMYAEDFSIRLCYETELDIRWTRWCSQATAGGLPVTNPALVTNYSVGLSCERHRMCLRHCTFNRYHKRLFTDRLPFPIWGNTRLDTHTAWQAVYNSDHHIRFQHDPVLVISMLYAIFWGFPAFRWLWADLTFTVHWLYIATQDI